MDEVLYNSLCRYFNALSKLGSMSYSQVDKLLVLIFYKHFVYEDYRGYLSKEDYRSIEMALDCLFGSSCLIPYPDYLKMGKLHLGDMTEVSQRIDQNESYAKDIDSRLKLNDSVTADNVRRIVNTETRVQVIEDTKVVKGKRQIKTVEDIVFPN